MKVGYPNVKVYAFPDYDHYLTDRHYDVSDSFYKLNIRVSLMSGVLNASIIINDAYDQIVNNKDLIFKIDIESNVSNDKVEYIFGSTHNDLTIMQNGEAVRHYNLVPYHNRIPRRFSKKLTNSAVDSLTMMLDDLYADHTLLRPNIDGIDVYIPSAIWVQNFNKYMEFVNRKGLSSLNDNFVFCWYEGSEIKIRDFEYILNQEPLEGIFVEEKLFGQMGYLMGDKVPVFKYEYMTERDVHTINSKLNASYVTTSTEKNGSFVEVIGTGENYIPIDRSCIYREMTYANGFEEINRLSTLNQYDSYSKFRTIGDIRIKPGSLIEIEDAKGLIKYVDIVDEVLYEFSQTESFTHVYTMSNSNEVEAIEITKELGFHNENYPEYDIGYEEEEEIYE